MSLSKVILRKEVDRYPDALVPAGETGTLIHYDLANKEIRVLMDRHIPGLEHWGNQLHWQSPLDFTNDTQFLPESQGKHLGLKQFYAGEPVMVKSAGLWEGERKAVYLGKDWLPISDAKGVIPYDAHVVELVEADVVKAWLSVGGGIALYQCICDDDIRRCTVPAEITEPVIDTII